MFALLLRLRNDRKWGYWSGNIHKFGFDGKVLIPSLITTPDMSYIQTYETVEEAHSSADELSKQLASGWDISGVELLTGDVIFTIKSRGKSGFEK